MKTFDLEGSKILVTGAAGFLGQYLTFALTEEKAQVFGTDVKKSCLADALDISDPEDIDRYIEQLELDGGKLDGIVNNAAVSFKGADITSRQFSKTLDVNVTGTNNMISKFRPLLSNDASIVNISSIYGILSPDFRIYGDNKEWYSSTAYGVSKAAIVQMTKYYAAQLAPIRVNTITPGGIFNNQNKLFSSRYSERVPLKRMAEPKEIVNAILFLLSSLSSYVNGHNLVVDGGLSIW